MYGWAVAIMAKRARAKELLSEVIGMSMMDAVSLIKAANIKVQVLSIDGNVCTTDGQFDSDRIGIVVNGGLVKGAQIG
jgi:hypothetical protein